MLSKLRICMLLVAFYPAISQASAPDEYIYCFPQNFGDNYNGLFASQSHTSIGALAANQDIPTFWYIKNKRGINTTYGKLTPNQVEHSKTQMIISGAEEVTKTPWKFIGTYVGSKYLEAEIELANEPINLRCMKSTTPINEFKFYNEDKGLPVDFENDSSIENISKLPKQSGVCVNDKLYPGFKLTWEYNADNIVTLKLHQPKVDNPKQSVLEEVTDLTYYTNKYHVYRNTIQTTDELDPAKIFLAGAIQSITGDFGLLNITEGAKHPFGENISANNDKLRQRVSSKNLYFDPDLPKQQSQEFPSILDLQSPYKSVKLNCTIHFPLPWKRFNETQIDRDDIKDTEDGLRLREKKDTKPKTTQPESQKNKKD